MATNPESETERRAIPGRVGTVVICVLAGFMITVAAIAARGTDLRADRSANTRELVTAQAKRNEQLRTESEQLRAQVASLSKEKSGGDDSANQLRQAGLVASTLPVSGPGVKVTLTDAPNNVKPAGVDDDALVVHQQDIQAVVNALWAGGAEAITIQGQRVISTTGIKCVGNSVVLHGIPYAPPYRIEAIGNREKLEKSLEDNPQLKVYKQYVAAYGLGYQFEKFDQLEAPAFVGAIGVNHATKAE